MRPARFLSLFVVTVGLAGAIPFGAAWLAHRHAHYSGLDAMRANVRNFDRALAFDGITVSMPDPNVTPRTPQQEAETIAVRNAVGPPVTVYGSALVVVSMAEKGQHIPGGGATSCVCWLVDIGGPNATGVAPNGPEGHYIPPPAPPGDAVDIMVVDAGTGHEWWHVLYG